ncbi:alpha/beta fold hydrolase [Actinotalea fermentans]|uniref:Hydrolase n=1 Tax=Actinotalea fermentans TaxID=43671 RepID=A0A511Z0M9_9CELL|nr:alpha/beta hydrolase [Actinotalea fermentans]KGM16758.1 alpha/beta hydrolase [Actinotalea fermentans ATCC 43279 = JCM 9966 = DSM 3133]GEN81021.1 hydrolase [Actinotalea fermentans]
MTDPSAVLVPGPWRHRFVPANAARFHVAEMEPVGGDGTPGADAGTPAPLVVLLHGFPQMWWAWRAQLPALAEAGYRAVAMDLRGTGASDKPPRGYDMSTLTQDVAGVIRSLGAQEAVVVGHGIGGTVAWSMAALQPEVTRAVGAFSALHPLRMHSSSVVRAMGTRTTARRLAFVQLPYFPERSMVRGDLVARVLADWGAPGWPPQDLVDVYRSAAGIPFAAHSVMEILRWLVRSTPRVDGQRYLAALRQPVAVPVLQVHGSADRAIPAGVASWGNGAPYRFESVPGAGHFLPEEAPEATTRILLTWLASLA